MFEKLTEMLDGNLESASAKINEALRETMTKMRAPYEQSINTKMALEGIASQMAALRDKLIPKQPTNAAAVTQTPAPAPAAAMA